MSRPLLLLIFSEHLNVLNGGRMPRDQAKSSYIKRCYDDMKRAPGTTISIAALRHMYDILSSYQKNATKQLKEVLHEIVQPLMKQFCTSLAKCHSNAVEKAQLLGVSFRNFFAKYIIFSIIIIEFGYNYLDAKYII